MTNRTPLEKLILSKKDRSKIEPRNVSRIPYVRVENIQVRQHADSCRLLYSIMQPAFRVKGMCVLPEYILVSDVARDKNFIIDN